MNNYETLFVIDPDLDEEATKACVQKFSDIITNNGGTIEKTDEWGKKRLAYPINDKNEGYYVLTTFKAAPSLPAELERNYKIAESIMRYIVVRLEDDK